MPTTTALPNERDLVDGQFAAVGLADIDGRPHAFVYVVADGVPDRHLVDSWILPADATLLRGLAGDLAAAADALDPQ